MKISEEKKNKISEQILMVLFEKSPQAIFTSHLAKEIIRDEEFIKDLLSDLKKKKLIVEIKKNSKGIDYLRRSRWKLSDVAYTAYKKLEEGKRNIQNENL